jgi:hypothetical protein
MNRDSYNPARDGVIIEGPTMPPLNGVEDPPLKNPKVDRDGNAISDLASPMHRA